MSEIVIDALEPVEVEVQQRDQLAGLLGVADGATDFAHEQLTVGQPGEYVVVSQVLDARLGPPALGGVPDDDQ